MLPDPSRTREFFHTECAFDPPNDRVDVWCFELDTPPNREDVLSKDEWDRARNMAAGQHRDRFVAARSTLRSLLGRYAKIAPEALAFEYGGKGKPKLRSENQPDLRFNVSHSRGLAAIAITCGREVGIDLETRQTVVDCMSIARRFFSQSEYRQLTELPENLKAKAFLRCWTRKEAFLKALGQGLAHSLQSFSASASPTLIIGSILIDSGSAKYTVTDLDLPEPCIAALAIEGETPPISVRQAADQPCATDFDA